MNLFFGRVYFEAAYYFSGSLDLAMDKPTEWLCL